VYMCFAMLIEANIYFSCADYTWRLWDVETGSGLLIQDGHNKECSAISFQVDGSLAFTTDWAGVALAWDLRSGTCVN
jgi:WD40 repeat protein